MLKMHYPHREKQSVQLLLCCLGLLTLVDEAKQNLELRSKTKQKNPNNNKKKFPYLKQEMLTMVGEACRAPNSLD